MTKTLNVILTFQKWIYQQDAKDKVDLSLCQLQKLSVPSWKTAAANTAHSNPYHTSPLPQPNFLLKAIVHIWTHNSNCNVNNIFGEGLFNFLQKKKQQHPIYFFEQISAHIQGKNLKDCLLYSLSLSLAKVTEKLTQSELNVLFSCL